MPIQFRELLVEMRRVLGEGACKPGEKMVFGACRKTVAGDEHLSKSGYESGKGAEHHQQMAAMHSKARQIHQGHAEMHRNKANDLGDSSAGREHAAHADYHSKMAAAHTQARAHHTQAALG